MLDLDLDVHLLLSQHNLGTVCQPDFTVWTLKIKFMFAG